MLIAFAIAALWAVFFIYGLLTKRKPQLAALGSVVMAAAVLTAGGVFWFIFGPESVSAPEQPKVVKINFAEWKAERERNQLAFSDKYKDVPVEFTAEMQTATDGIGGITVELIADGLPAIGIFSTGQRESLRRINRGDSFQAVCNAGLFVDLQECKVSK